MFNPENGRADQAPRSQFTAGIGNTADAAGGGGIVSMLKDSPSWVKKAYNNLPRYDYPSPSIKSPGWQKYSGSKSQRGGQRHPDQ